MISNAVGIELLSRIVGYNLTAGDFSESSPNLPMRVAIIGEANIANQAGLDTTPRQLTTAQEAGSLYGFGSPLYHVMRILRPVSGSGIGGIPTVIYPQLSTIASAPKIMSVSALGTATANGTHTVKISGRGGIDGTYYNIDILVGDDAAAIATKIQDSVNNVLGSPVIGVADPYACTMTTKWAGLTAEELKIEVETNDFDLGITYAVVDISSAAGTPSITAAMDAFGNEWNTIVVNTYGLHSQTMDTLEQYNGIPDPQNPTGRYTGTRFNPFVALSGSVENDPSAITDVRSENVTISVCPAPLSKAFSFEAAANACLLFARKTQDTPHLDIGGQSYVDMPVPTETEWAGARMAQYLERDRISKAGCSTVDLVSGRYEMQDFITTYHPIGEVPPQYKYCRNLVGVDWNVRFGYFLREQINVVDHVIAEDNDTVNASRVIKPKRWIGLLTAYANDLTLRGLIVEPSFFVESLRVGISTVNPDRLETFFRYKRSGVVRIASTTAEAGFNFGEA